MPSLSRAALLPFVFRSARLSIGIVLGLITLTIIPSFLAKLVFNVPTPWLIVTLLNAVYALTALIVYCDWSTAAELLTPRKFATKETAATGNWRIVTATSNEFAHAERA
jgi:uncharacterized protein YqhQ